MLEAVGNLWDVEADLRCITTNGATRKSDGAAVMGRGCAREAKTKFPGIDFRLGELLRKHGNRVMRLMKLPDGSHLASFPVKHNWREQADPDLIRRSAEQLVALADKFGYERVVLPRPGCGNGKLSYDQVRPILAGVLDERFAVITFCQKGLATSEPPQRFKIEVRSYNSADDLGLGRYRSRLMDPEYTSREDAQTEASRLEEQLIASGALVTLEVVPV